MKQALGTLDSRTAHEASLPQSQSKILAFWEEDEVQAECPNVEISHRWLRYVEMIASNVVSFPRESWKLPQGNIFTHFSHISFCRDTTT